MTQTSTCLPKLDTATPRTMVLGSSPSATDPKRSNAGRATLAWVDTTGRCRRRASSRTRCDHLTGVATAASLGGSVAGTGDSGYAAERPDLYETTPDATVKQVAADVGVSCGVSRGPLSFNEVTHLARSIARWTWRNTTRKGYHDHQVNAGRKGGKIGGIRSGEVRRAKAKAEWSSL